MELGPITTPPSFSVIDSHAHLDQDAFKDDVRGAVDRAKNAGVCAMLQIIMGPNKNDIVTSLDLTKQHKDFMFPTLGIHPHDAKLFNFDALQTLKSFFKNYKFYAVGEIGLDYYYENSPKKIQTHCFDQLLNLAKEQSKPICVHTRDAFDDTFVLCKNHDIFNQHGGVIHCFSSNKAEAKKFLDLGAYISFSGIVTFNKAQDVQDAAKYVPMDRILIETDSPFLAPVPFRGKRNEPAYTVKVLDHIAALKGLSRENLARHTFNNTVNLFKLPLQLQ
ncbi:MAG TPA: TatD family hydrolase [Oligoflexia bacterium]|nr:TatD family hydrolase [Oligoflexia bacterium]HMR24418.1 TatD family hydrolase [Oligoflexia bacterium]